MIRAMQRMQEQLRATLEHVISSQQLASTSKS